MTKQQGLGRGLSALFSEYGGPDDSEAASSSGVRNIQIKMIRRNEAQPRKSFEDEAINELARSIEQHGILQPLLLSRDGEFYKIVAGERRLRAAIKAGLTEVPAVIRDFGDRELLEAALTENIQREDLNDIECAMAYRTLSDEYGLSQEQIAERVGKSRSHVANTMRLLSLPEGVQKLIARGDLTAGHARAVLSVGNEKDRLAFAEYIADRGLSVREAEAAARTFGKAKEKKMPRASKSPYIARIEDGLSGVLGAKTVIEQGKKGGVIRISYYNDEDLSRLVEIITSEKE
ncbi:MAG: ParB/RepB/Spo0J family partition protein [Eubacteriaceae bacterium]|nr:ParB/RepB/Spo0J family partition protein [Eubacteriaceae bacterium]